MMTFLNGARSIYGNSSSAAVGLNDWTENMSASTARVRHRDSEQSRDPRSSATQRPCAPALSEERGQRISSSPSQMVEHGSSKFCRWLDGGPGKWRHVEANLHAAALIFTAGIERAQRPHH